MHATLAQTILQEKRNKLDTLLDIPNEKLVTRMILDSILTDNMYRISGTNIKEGKSAASAATIDDKSATVNLSFKLKESMFFIQPTLSASSFNGFVDVFSSDKYNRVFSGGVNVQRFLYSSIISSNYDSTRTRLHNSLRIVRKKYRNLVDDVSRTDPWEAARFGLLHLFRMNETFFQRLSQNLRLSEDDVTSGSAAEEYHRFYEFAKELVEAGILDKEDLKKDPTAIYNKVNGLTSAEVNDIYWRKMITITDSLQYQIPVTKFIKWINGGILYNNQPQPMLDSTRPGKTRSFYNQYFSAKVGFNMLFLRMTGNSFYMFPNISLSNPRNFQDTDKKTANFVSQVTIGGTTVQRVDSTISYFEKKPDRTFAWSLELPFLWYWKSSKLGLDVAVHVGENDPKGDNVGARIGLYMPVGTKDETILSVEPLIRIQKLFAKSTDVFFKDNFVFGFNVSVSVPAFLR